MCGQGQPQNSAVRTLSHLTSPDMPKTEMQQTPDQTPGDARSGSRGGEAAKPRREWGVLVVIGII